ncbi:hypothetical protein BC936DRAFT_137166 [Jimgerdemannia flammicorona]|uniref:Uncharacterized protein n=1 Tax=Jimgerdemannia flammicorona TaxID=994334 RepID=A0A433DJL5_9FUNG|nr:hypothetical protein BC936DRAFT_137166 [Jimgerdemannia flammicorona]
MEERNHHQRLLRARENIPSPCLAQMLQDGFALVRLNPLGHHIDDIVHDGGAELEVIVGLDALLGDGLCDTFGVTTLEMTGEQVAEPALQERHNTAHEEEPYAPPGCPDTHARALADRAGVEAVC